MVICKEIDDYLKYVKEHPNWINKKRKQLIKNIVKPLLKRNDIFFDKETYENCLEYCKVNYYELFPYQKFIYAFVFMYKDDIPVFPKFLIKEGRGNGKDGFIVPLANFLQTPLYGVRNYHVEIVANSEDQVKDTFNPYIECHPTYKIAAEGMCTLKINGKTMTANVGQNLTIDTDRMIAYREDGTLNNTKVSGNYEDMYLQPGNNKIEFYGGNLKVIPNWRCL